LGRTDSIPPLPRRNGLARRKMESDLDMKTACEMSAKITDGGSVENRMIARLTPIVYQFQQAVDATREVYRSARPEDYKRAVPSTFEGAWYFFPNGRTDGTFGPKMIEVGRIAEVTVHADGRQETKCLKKPCE
jgi:hypothetical protein